MAASDDGGGGGGADLAGRLCHPVHALCSVVFDIDVGQRLEHCHPEGALSEEEARDLAFHSFPVRRVGGAGGRAAPAPCAPPPLPVTTLPPQHPCRIQCRWSCTRAPP